MREIDCGVAAVVTSGHVDPAPRAKKMNARLPAGETARPEAAPSLMRPSPAAHL
jgi:hypothetical protein